MKKENCGFGALETSTPIKKTVTLTALEYLQFTLIAKQYKEYYDIIVHKAEVEVTASYNFLTKIGY
jgi:hypothetical protein